mgnify:CR=1 FL=1
MKKIIFEIKNYSSKYFMSDDDVIDIFDKCDKLKKMKLVKIYKKIAKFFGKNIVKKWIVKNINSYKMRFFVLILYELNSSITYIPTIFNLFN